MRLSSQAGMILHWSSYEYWRVLSPGAREGTSPSTTFTPLRSKTFRFVNVQHTVPQHATITTTTFTLILTQRETWNRHPSRPHPYFLTLVYTLLTPTYSYGSQIPIPLLVLATPSPSHSHTLVTHANTTSHHLITSPTRPSHPRSLPFSLDAFFHYPTPTNTHNWPSNFKKTQIYML